MSRFEWSSTPIDASFLDAFDGNVNLSANNVRVGPLAFSSANVSVEIDRSRAVATVKNLVGYGGSVTGQFVMNNRSGLSVGGNLDAVDVGLKDFLTDTISIDRFTGTGNLSLEFLGGGESMAVIMNSLSGTGSMDIGTGTISGIDLDSLFRGDSGDGTTIFDSMSATWNIASGTLTNEDLLLSLPGLESAGVGKIGLGAQNMDYTLLPTLKTSDGATTIFPIRIIGDWTDLKIYPDLEAIIKQDLGAQAKALEAEVKQAAQDEVKQKLGLGESEAGPDRNFL